MKLSRRDEIWNNVIHVSGLIALFTLVALAVSRLAQALGEAIWG